MRVKIKCEDKDEMWERFDAVTLQAERLGKEVGSKPSVIAEMCQESLLQMG